MSGGHCPPRRDPWPRSKKKKTDEKAEKPAPPPTPRLQTLYEEQIVPQLGEKLGRKNRLSLPRLEKIVVSMGVGSAISDKKHMEEATSALAEITGQKPVRCKATQEHRRVPAPRRAGRRLQSDAPPGPDVRVPGPA